MPKAGERNPTEIRTFERRFLWPALPLFVALVLGAGASGLDDREQVLAGPVPMFYPASLVLAALLVGCMIAVAAMTESLALRIVLIVGPLVVFVLYGVTFYIAKERAGELMSANLAGTGGGGEGFAGGESVWSWTAAVVAAVLLLGAGLAAALFVHRPRHPTTAEPEPADPDLARQVSAAISAGRAALGDHIDDHVDDRAAVIACYAAMEDALRGHGLRRGVADTPSELLERAGSTGLYSHAGEAAAVVLVGLFQRARFSTGPLPPTARDEAESALERLAMDLDSTVAAGEAQR